jgi:hypothetical protein
MRFIVDVFSAREIIFGITKYFLDEQCRRHLRTRNTITSYAFTAKSYQSLSPPTKSFEQSWGSRNDASVMVVSLWKIFVLYFFFHKYRHKSPASLPQLSKTLEKNFNVRRMWVLYSFYSEENECVNVEFPDLSVNEKQKQK